MMRLKFQPQAVHDLEGIGAYIAADNPDRAVTFIRQLRNLCHRIGQTLWPIAYDLTSQQESAVPHMGGM
ncbi:hypothetical protein SAMN05661003_11330 [Desulfuromonas thiophila]|uniref:ParE toxin of type II toxin-antitoxin system, parDE n=1 Tax=Desulfuromonas thiophila TaxID=57664 RepID=A0A1G7DFH6_9BACT|nr:type II toxin-antitoxin system RelE/ParE family toxin [Desulfuromonas thiophila]SDE49555.1 hypothetical protein SAMN05661003_11330 [Desulfuromonas thiophila]